MKIESMPMAKQTLFFESECNLSLSNGNILVTYPDTSTLQRPIEDIATVIIDHHSVHVTIPLLNPLSSSGVSVVFCNDNHMPVGMLQDLEPVLKCLVLNFSDNSRA